MRKIISTGFLGLVILLSCASCQKNNQSFGQLYTPTATDVTPTATLEELNQGRSLYMNNCGNCHGLYSPDNFSPSDWKIILKDMVPRTGMSGQQAELVAKYISRGKL